MSKRRKSPFHGVLVVDKPRGPTSHDVVGWARRAFTTRSVGHAGTLDPMATGVLVLGVGEGTKLLRWLTADDKSYEATLSLGAQTDTLDAEGEVVETAPVPALDAGRLDEVARGFVGTKTQVPPRFSAIRVDGVRLHEAARRGEAVEPPPRQVQLHRLEVEPDGDDRLTLSLTCAKGYYVRSLGRDLALALETRGHLTALRRTASGPFTLADAVDGAQLKAAAKGDEGATAAIRARLLGLVDACRSMPEIRLDEVQVQDALHGRPITADSPAEPGPYALLDSDGALVAIGDRSDSGLRVVRGIRV